MKKIKNSCWWLLVFLTHCSYRPPVWLQTCLRLISAVLWGSEWVFAGTILLTPSFPFPWQPHPPSVPPSGCFCTTPLPSTLSSYTFNSHGCYVHKLSPHLLITCKSAFPNNCLCVMLDWQTLKSSFLGHAHSWIVTRHWAAANCFHIKHLI